MEIRKAQVSDLPEILDLQKLCFRSEAAIYGEDAVPPLRQTLENIHAEFSTKLFLKLQVDGMLAGSIRAAVNDRTVRLEKLIVHPDFQNRGFGHRLIQEAEKCFPEAFAFELMTGKQSLKNIHLYSREGYRVVREEPGAAGATMVWMEKRKAGLSQPSSSEPDDCGWICA